jgi:hypothetical protein
MYVHLSYNPEPIVDWLIVAQVTIDMLPDVALLRIFDFYVYEEQIEVWHTLVHVCRKWRNLIFGSPRRLDLRLHCMARTPVKEMLDVWPLLPIAVWSNGHKKWGVDNIVAALQHNDRICELGLFDIPNSQVEKVLVAMQQPFPALTRLHLRSRHETAPVNPNSFLGGSASRLQKLWLTCIPFPGLPKLLASATQIVDLDLRRIPLSGYISPEAMVTCLSALTGLNRLLIGFNSPRCRPDRKIRRLPPSTRTVLPALTEWRFFGVSEYLEDFVARIDAPLLTTLAITFFYQLIFDTPQLTWFISRTPKFEAHGEARVVFSDWDVLVTLPQTLSGVLELGISCRQPDWQLSSLAQVCSRSFPRPFIPAVERLFIVEDGFPRLHWQDDIENSQWLELFHPFSSVKYLYISSEFAPRIAPALQELVGERGTEMLNALRSLFLEDFLPSGRVHEIIGRFAAARQRASHPIAVSRWERTYTHPPLETAKLNWASE